MKKTIIILIIIATLLITAGITITLTSKQSSESKRPEEKEEVLEEDPSTKYTELKEIKTPDKIITLESTTAYYSKDSNLSGVNINIISKENFDNLYLKIIFKFSNDEEKRIIYLENVEANKPISYIIQSNNDYSKITSWQVIKLTKEEAQNEGFNLE